MLFDATRGASTGSVDRDQTAHDVQSDLGSTMLDTFFISTVISNFEIEMHGFLLLIENVIGIIS